MDKSIFELKQELNAFLKEHPELKPLQEEIDKRLEGAGNQNNRLVIIHQMMMSKVAELSKTSKELQTKLENILKDINSLRGGK